MVHGLGVMLEPGKDQVVMQGRELQTRVISRG